MRAFARSADWLFPRRCALCDEILGRDETGICVRCADRAERARRPRERGGALPVFAPFSYEGAVRESVLRMKYKMRPEYARWYGSVLAEEAVPFIRRLQPQGLVPVPLHESRRRERGYNQAEEVARILARRCGIPLRADAAERVRKTLPQNGLTPARRRENVKDAFRAGRKKIPAHVMLVDDICTTGATCEALADALSEKGVRVVGAVCLCIAPHT